MPSKMKKRQPLGRRLLNKHVPITKWMLEYDSEKAVADLIAGVTVGLTVIPQALAYAALAGLEPQYGLYSSMIGCFVYAIFGSCRQITIGPTALMSLMTYQQVMGRNADFAVLLCFLTGILQFVMGVLHLGVLIDFISIPVTVGFTSATSVIIAVSQIKGLLGLKFSSNGFVDTIKMIAEHICETRMSDTLMGVSCIVFLLLMRKLKDLNLPAERRVLKKCLWLLSTSRNAIVVLICSVVTYLCKEHYGLTPFILTGTVRSGLPEVEAPPFSTTLGNRTLSFMDMCNELGSSIVLVPVIGVLGNVAIAKAFASGSRIDATQELVTLSLCNVFGSFFNAMPVTGSFSRSAVNHASGVATQFGGVYTGVLVILALSLLTPYFFFIPKAALAAVVICAVIFMIEYEVVKPMWKSRRSDLLSAFASFVLCLLVGVELGIVAGVAVDIAFLIYPNARPQLQTEIKCSPSGTQFTIVKLGSSLYFPGVERLRQSVTKAARPNTPVVIDCRQILGIDFTAAKGLCSLSSELAITGSRLVLLGPNSSVAGVLSNATRILSVVHDEDALEISLQELNGEVEMPLLSIRNEEGDITPPPSYTALPIDSDDKAAPEQLHKESP